MSLLIFIIGFIISASVPVIAKSNREVGFYALGALVGMALMIRWM